MSGSRIIIAEDGRLPNPHPGEFLREDFLVGEDLPIEEVAAGSGIAPDVLARLLLDELAVNAEIDLRLSRYFGMREGFFLALQSDYDLAEARDALEDALDRIVPRAA